MADRPRRQWVVAAVTVVATIAFSTVATELGWPFWIVVLFVAVIWGVHAARHRQNFAEITLYQLTVFALSLVALAGGLWAFTLITEGVWAIAIAFVYILALWALVMVALKRRPR